MSFTQVSALPGLQGFLGSVSPNADQNLRALVLGLADPQSPNSYSYVENNPLKYTDPTGKGPEMAIPIAFVGAYTPTFLGEYTSNIIANVQYGNYQQAFFPNNQTVTGFRRDAVDAGFVAAVGETGIYASGLAASSFGLSSAATVIAKAGANFVGTGAAALSVDAWRKRSLDFINAGTQGVGAVVGGYAVGNSGGRYPVPGSSTFAQSMVTGSHAIYSGAQNAVGTATGLSLSRILAAISGVIAAFSSTHK